MNRAYAIVGWGIVALGLVHTVATAWIFPALTNGSVWFLSGGIATVGVGILNLYTLRNGMPASDLRRVCVMANVTMCGFAGLIGLAAGTGRTLVAVTGGMFVVATVLAFRSTGGASSDRARGGERGTLAAKLDHIHSRARGIEWLYWFAALNRVALAVGFTPSGLTKIVGNRFTTISPATPIGGFFEAMYLTGVYWKFLGACQLTAAVLLILPGTATLGAVLYFPIILNIFVITVSLHFAGTPFIVGLMLLANVFLLCWDYDRLKPLWARALG